MDLGSIYSSLEFKIDSLESNITKAIQGFYKLQLGTAEASKLMDTSVVTAVNNIDKSYKLLEMSNQRVGLSMFNNSKYVESLKERMSLLSNEINKTDSTMKDLVKEFGQGSKEVESYKSHVLDLKVKHAELNQELNKSTSMSGRLEHLNTGLKATEDRFAGFTQIGQRVSGVGRDITLGLTTPIVGAGIAALKTSADFEQGMSNIKAVTGASSGDMGKFRELAIKTGKDTAFSASEAAKGIEELAKAGLTTGQILDGGLKGALDLAAAGELSLGEAAEIASTALNAFKRDNISVTEAANLLAGAANASATDVKEMKFALSMCSAVASSVGVSFKDTSTALAVFAQNGLKGSDAGTSLKTMLLNLQPHTEGQYKEFQKLGLMTYDVDKAFQFLSNNGVKVAEKSFASVDSAMKSFVATQTHTKEGTAKFKKAYKEMTDDLGVSQSAFVDANGHMKGMGEIADLLKTHLEGLTDAQKQQALQTMFGTDAIRAATIMSKEGAKGFSDMYGEMSKVTAAETAAEKMNNLKGSIEEFKGSVETAAIQLGTSMIPTIRSFTDHIKTLVDNFIQLTPAQQQTYIKFGLITAAIGPCILIIGKLMESVSTIYKGIQLFKGLFIAEKIVAAGTAATGAAGGVGALSAATKISTLALNPWILGIGASTFALYNLAKYLKSDCVQSVDIFSDRIIKSNKKVGESFKTLDTGAKVSMSDMNNKVKAAAENSEVETLKISESTKKAVSAYMELDKKAGVSLLSLQANNAKVTENISKDMKKNILDDSKKLAQDLVKNIDGMYKQIVSGLQKRQSEAKQTFQDFFKNANNITDTEKSNILKSFENGYEQQKKIAENAKNRINEIYQTAANNNKQITDSELKEIQSLQEAMKEQAINTLTQSQLEQQAIYEGIKNNASHLTTEQASEVIKNSAHQRDESIRQANEQAKKVEAEIIYQRDVTKTISADQAQKLIDEAERQRKDSVSKAEQMHKQVVSEVEKQCSDVAKKIDEKSGEIKKNWQQLCDWFTNHVIKPVVDMSSAQTPGLLANSQGHYATGTDNAQRGFNELAEDGFEIVAKRGFRWFEGGEKVFNHEESKKLLGSLAGIGNVENISGQSKQQARIWGSDLCEGFAEGLNQNAGLVHDAAINVADKMYRVLHFTVPDEGPLKDAATYGPDFMELLAQTIEQNADKPKEAAKNVAEKINAVIKQKQKELKTEIDDIKSSEKKQIDELQKQLRDTRDSETVDLRGTKKDTRYGIQDSYKAQKEAIQDKVKAVRNGCEAEIKARKDAVDKEIELLKKGGKEASEQLKKEAEAKKKAVQDIDKLDSLIVKALQRKIEAERDAALETAKTKAKESKLTKDQLSSLLNYTKEFYDKKLDQDKLQATAEQLIMSKNQQTIITLLNKFGRLYEDSGTTLGQRMVGGMKSWTDMVPSIVGNAMQNVQVTVKDAAVNIENTLSSIMEGIQSVGEAGAAVGALSGGGNFNFDSIFSDWKTNKSDEDKVKEIADKYKQAFNKIELAMIELGRETKNSDEELRKQQKTIDLQKEKLSELNKEYEEMKNMLGENDDEVVSLRKDIASLNIEIENNILKLKQDEIENKYKKQYDAIELSIEKLNKETKNFNEELERQSNIYIQYGFKINAMKAQYDELVKVLGKDAEAVKQLEKDILSFQNEIDSFSKKANDDVINHINEFSNKIKEAIKARYEEELRLEEDKINKELENLNKWKEESIKRISEVYDAKIKALDEEVKAEDRAEKNREELSKINRLKEAIDFEHNEFNKVEMNKELSRLIDERNKRLHKEDIEDKKKTLEEQKQNEINNINNLYETNKNNLEKQLQDTKNYYSKLLDEAHLRAEAEKMIVANNQEEIITLIKSYSKDYEEAGKTLGQKFADSMQAKIKPVLDMIEEVTNKINNLRTKEIEDAKKIVSFKFEKSNLYGTSGNTTNSNVDNSKTIVNHNSFTFNSPKNLSPNEMRRNTETTLRNLAFGM